MKTKSEMILTSGNLFVKTFKFVLPLMMTTIFQLLYTTIDLWTVSKFGGGSLSMSAIGSNGALINLIITVLVCLATGANVCISVAKGANDKEKADRILHTAFIIAFFGGIIFSFLGFFLAPVMLRVMDTPIDIIDNATLYLKIYFIGLPLQMVYNFGAQMLRALGDSKRPLYILIISGLLNVFADLLFVCIFKLDVAGVAYATILSQGVSATLVILWFRFSPAPFASLRFKSLKLHKKEFKEILRIGLPAGLQGLAFSIPNVIIQSSLYTINNYYIDGVLISQGEIVSGAAASTQIEGYVFAVIDAFAVGLISLTGQNYGALKKINMRKCYWFAVSWMLIFWAITSLVCNLFPEQLLSIFVKESPGLVVDNALAAGKKRLVLMTLTYALDGWMDINGCYLKGMKKSTPPAIITLIGCTGTRIFFLLTLFPLEFFHTISWLYAAFPISWTIVNIVYIPVVLIIEHKKFKEIDFKLAMQ